MRSLHHHHCDMGDSALPSGEYEFRSQVGKQKRKHEVRLFMSMMMNRCSSSSSSSKRRKTTSSSYDTVVASSSFNEEDHEDLIWEILFRLPPKYVLQFKCVSKRWYSIISNPVFPRNHYLRYHRLHPQPLHNEFLLLPQDDKKQVLLLNLLDHYSPVQQPLADLSVLPVTGVPVAEGPDFVFVDSCNGLILYADAHNGKGMRGRRCISRRFFKDEDDDLYYLCNPVTKDYIKLPNLKHALLFEEDENQRVWYTNLDTRIFFDPSVSLSYKVIRFVCRSVRRGYPPNVSSFQFYIYSSESGSWRLSTSFAGSFQFASNNNVFLNGVMYWVTTGTDLLCFDAEKNSVWFQPLPLKPKPNLEHRKPFYFGKCGGRLCLIEKYSYTDRGRCDLTLHDGFDILEMTTEDTRWTKKYRVNLGVNHQHLIGANIRILHIYKTRNQFNEEEEEALLMKIDGRIVSFSLKSNTFFGKELTIPNSKQPYSHGDIHPTFLTFVPLSMD